MKLYLRYFSIHLKSRMQYKTSFFINVFGQFLSSFAELLSVWFLMSRFHRIEGFGTSEVLLCYSVILTAFSLAEWLARGFDSFSAVISNGEFDRIMVRPRNVMLQVLGSRIEFSKLGRLLQAAVVMIYALRVCRVEWTAGRAAVLVMTTVSGTAVFSGLFIIYASLCFFTTEGLEVMNIFTHGGVSFGGYPFSVYGKKVLRFFTYIVPLALVQYYPLMYILGRSDNTAYMLSPLIAMLFPLPCLMLWRFGIRHYRSTGS